MTNIPKFRDYNAMDACLRTGGFMKDRRAPRGGSHNSHREYLEEAMDDLVCDFCGKPVPKVRRIALDQDYDRLCPPIAPKYACETCSAEKEQTRLEMSPEIASDGL